MMIKYNFAISLLIIASVTVLLSQIRDEIVSRYPDGMKKEIIVYEGEGRNETILKRLYYSESGSLEKENDVVSGKEKTYYETGSLKSVHDVENGKDTTYFETGEIKSSSIDSSDGSVLEEKSYYKNGNIKTEKFKNIFVSYYENGRIKKELINYGKLNFERKEYFYDEKDTTIVVISRKNGNIIVNYHTPYNNYGQLNKKAIYDDNEKINEKYNEYTENGDTLNFLPLVGSAYLGGDYKLYSNDQRKIIKIFSTRVSNQVHLTVINFINLPVGSDCNTNNSENTDFQQRVFVSGFIQGEIISDIILTNFLMKLEQLKNFSNIEINVDEARLFTKGLLFFSLCLQNIPTTHDDVNITTIPSESFFIISPKSVKKSSIGGLSLTGISWHDNSGYAVLNGQISQVGEVISGYLIEEIAHNYVIFRNINNNSILRLTLNEK